MISSVFVPCCSQLNKLGTILFPARQTRNMLGTSLEQTKTLANTHFLLYLFPVPRYLYKKTILIANVQHAQGNVYIIWHMYDEHIYIYIVGAGNREQGTIL